MKLTLEQRKGIQLKGLLEAHDLKVGDVFKIQSNTYRDDLLYRIAEHKVGYDTSDIGCIDWKCGQRNLSDILSTSDITKVEPRWKPENGDEYFYATVQGDVDNFQWVGDHIDTGYFQIGNCFRTKEEAEEFGKKVREFCLGLMTDL